MDLLTQAEPGQFPQAREFQLKAIDALRLGVINGMPKQVLCAPTGAGKTYLALWLANAAAQKRKRALFICDRIELIDQTLRSAIRYGLADIGVIQADHHLQRPNALFQIASAQTIARRKAPDNIDLIIVDEAHTVYKSWVEIVKAATVPVIGLTATPFTKGLGKLFHRVVNAATMKQLTEEGVLCRARFFAARAVDLRGVEIKNGEYVDSSVAERVRIIIGDIVSEWERLAKGKKSIAFVPTVEAGEWLRTQFMKAGYRFEVISYRTPDVIRKRWIDEFRKPDSEIIGLISVDALAKGFDVPSVECVIDAKPLRKSFSSYVQMVGRGLRSSPGKSECLILDHSANVHRFAMDFEALYFSGVQSLSDEVKKDSVARVSREEGGDAQAGQCPQCGHTPFVSQCMHCGFTKPRIVANVRMVSALLRERQVFGKRDAVQAPRLFREVLSIVMSEEKSDEKKVRKARAMYHHLSGFWPKNEWFGAQPIPPCPETLKRYQAAQAAYVRSIIGKHRKFPWLRNTA